MLLSVFSLRVIFKNNMKKILIFIALGTILTVAFGLSVLFFYTYSVSGRITDLVNKEPIPNIKARIGEFTDETSKDGQFQIKNIKIYQRKALKIEVSKDYEGLQPISLDYSKRSLTKNIELEPTFETMMNRFHAALRNYQFDYLWDYIHPDDQEYWDSKEDFVKTFKKLTDTMTELGCSTPEYEMREDVRLLKTWEYSITGKEYRDVTEVPLKVRQICGGKEQSSDNSYHYQKIDGIWRIFTGGNKAELEEELTRFRSRFEESY